MHFRSRGQKPGLLLSRVAAVTSGTFLETAEPQLCPLESEDDTLTEGGFSQGLSGGEMKGFP